MLLAYLFTRYGTIGQKVLRESKLKVRETAYDIMDPLVIIYNEVEELGHLGHVAQNPYSMSQLVNCRLMIIKDTNELIMNKS